MNDILDFVLKFMVKFFVLDGSLVQDLLEAWPHHHFESEVVELGNYFIWEIALVFCCYFS